MKISTLSAAGVCAAAITAGMLLAPTAQAKSSVAFTVDRRTVQAGQSVTTQASGGNDAAGVYSSICIEEQQAGHPRWYLLACAPPTEQGTSILSKAIQFTRPGSFNLRAILSTTDAHGGHRHLHQASAPVTIRVDR